MPSTRKIKYAFRLVHIENIPYILKCGFVHKDSPCADPNYVEIGDKTVIKTRETRAIGNRKISSYIPFYFGPRSPMLYVIQHGYNGVKQYGAEYLVYCILKIEDIISNHIDCIFTDGHPLNDITNTYPCSELVNLDEYVSFNDVYTKYWVSEDDWDLKRRKEAELLILNELSPLYIKGFVVYNERAYEKLLADGISKERIVLKPDYYF